MGYPVMRVTALALALLLSAGSEDSSLPPTSSPAEGLSSPEIESPFLPIHGLTERPDALLTGTLIEQRDFYSGSLEIHATTRCG